MTKILITGGTGLVGTRLTKRLMELDFEVAILTRNPQKEHEFKWDLSKGYIDEKAFENIDFIIHLAGAGIADERWTEKRKQVIIDSRVMAVNLLFTKVIALKIPLKKFISASATGFYGAVTSDKIFTEKDVAAKDFLGDVCELWETATSQFEKENIKTTILRTGIVLSEKGGALAKMKTPIISSIGSGNQFLPWIHLDDLCGMYVKVLKDETMVGIFNAVAPEHHTSKSFSKIFANSIKRIFIPIGVPRFLLKLIFGEMAIILLEGSRVSSVKIEKTGFIFQYPNLKRALTNLFN
jgi:hypothetical protein